MRIVAACLLTAFLGAVEVPLRAPLTTLVPVEGPVPAGGVVVSAEVTVPANAPADLGLGAWCGDRHGSWAGLPGGALTPGRHAVRIDLGADQPLAAEAGWGPWQAAGTARAGLYLWSATPSAAVITVDHLAVTAAAPAAGGDLQVLDLDLPAQATTGSRWQATFRLSPEPADPFDPAVAKADLIITRPDGRVERRPAFWDQPMVNRDRGDAEEIEPAGPGRFAVRWRPRVPGVHRVRLEVAAGGRQVTADLPPLTVAGGPWDGYARVDAQDPRFLAVEGRFWWPVGINLRSVHDDRSVQYLQTKPVPERGSLAMTAYLDRFAAHGVDAAEVWLASWSLALEWHPGWPGYGGPGRYHLGHAWRLDRILERAEANGQRLILAINNHGQGSSDNDREWRFHPYRRGNGGFLDDAGSLFTDARAKVLQARLRRYLVARYGDSPAVLAWKLWTEVDLTDAGHDKRWPEIAAWHREACADLAALDTYAHPITTHTCSTWRSMHPSVASLPGIGLLTIDAYHGPADEPSGMLLADLLASSVGDRGLGKYRKPALVTENGGNWNAADPVLLAADQATGPWVGFVTGHAGSPMLWWSNWVDQGGRFGPYDAIRAFMAGEDLRGAEAKIAVLRGEPDGLWIRGWVRPGRFLGYVLARDYGARGEDATVSGGRVRIGDAVPPGRVAITWWDADRGTPGTTERFDHPGGALVLDMPTFRRHIAFKMERLP